MKKKYNRPDQASILRKQAEEIAREQADPPPENQKALSLEETRRMLHEVRVHQIELEMQNEELRRAHAELDAVRARYFDLYDLAPVGYCTLSEKGLIVEANITAAALLGTARGVLVQRPFSQFILKEDQDIYYLHRKKCLKTGEPQACELRMVKTDGAPFWGHLTATAVDDAAGEAMFRVVLADITERKRSEEILRRYELIARHSRDKILFIRRDDGRILEANTAAVTAYGHTREELLAMTIHDLRTAETSDLTADQMAAADNQGLLFETVHRRSDGSTFPVEVSSQGATIGDQRMLISVIRDITKRKRVEKQLFETSQRLQALMQAAPVGISFSDDATCQRITGNPAVLEQFEAGLEDNLSASAPNGRASGRQVRYYQEGRRIGDEELPLQRAVAENKVIPPMELEISLPSGRRWFAESSGAPVRDAEGSVIAGIAVTLDITGRKLAEMNLQERTAQLEAANKELESFSYSVSHDLRSPLRAIDGYARIILKKEGNKFEKDTLRQFNEIRVNAQRMGQLIDDLLAFSRLGKGNLSVSKLDMGALVSNAFQELGADYLGRNIDLAVHKIPPGYGDRNLIKQVYVNLLANAIKFSARREEVRIETGGYLEGSETVYYVKDNGAGFDMKYSDKLFGVFQRLHAAEDFEGTGIGLAIVQRIIHRHGGRVWAEGKENGGATFYFSLPRPTHDLMTS